MSKFYHNLTFYGMKRNVIFTTRYYCNVPVDGNSKPPPLRWTRPWTQKEGEWYSRFKLFTPKKDISVALIKFMTSPVDLRPRSILEWWKDKAIDAQIADQQFLKERHSTLGNDLAAAHFIVYRGGSVRFLGRDQWVKKDKDDEYNLPGFYQPNMFLTDIDCSNMMLHYEGLENIVRLKKLEWLSFKNCPFFDDFCLDRISGEFGGTLIHLDISGCPISENGLVALYRMTKLETLIVSDLNRSKAFELTCAMLEELHPRLVIKSDENCNPVTA